MDELKARKVSNVISKYREVDHRRVTGRCNRKIEDGKLNSSPSLILANQSRRGEAGSLLSAFRGVDGKIFHNRVYRVFGSAGDGVTRQRFPNFL